MKDNKMYIINELKNDLEFAKKQYEDLIKQPKHRLDKEAIKQQLDKLATLKMRLELAQSDNTPTDPKQMLLFD